MGKVFADTEKTPVDLPGHGTLRQVADWVEQCGNQQMAEWLRYEAARKVKLDELDLMIGSALKTMMKSEEFGRLGAKDVGRKVSEVTEKLTEAAMIPPVVDIPKSKMPPPNPRGGVTTKIEGPDQ